MNWPLVPLGEVLTLQRRWVKVEPTETYTEIGVRRFGNGIFHKAPIAGQTLRDKRVLAIRPGDLVFNNVFAWEGAAALAGLTEDGTIGSHRFVTFTPDTSRCSAEFYCWFFTSEPGLAILQKVSPGLAGRNRTLSLAQFQPQMIPLPPLTEQRRIVARVDAIASRVAEACRLAEHARGEANFILRQAAQNAFDELETDFELNRFGDLDPHVTSGPRSWAARYVDAGTRFYRAQDLLPEGRLATSGKVFIEPPDTNQGQGAQLRPGDLMLVITGATVGWVAEYPRGIEPGYVSQHVAICRLPTDVVIPRFALWRLLSTQGQAELTGQSYGQGKPGLNLSNIRNLTLPIPPLDQQRRVVAHLDALQAKLDAVRAEQTATATELDALLPSVLNRAFAGEL